jgi:ABC transport system ATP-binding/permease protein
LKAQRTATPLEAKPPSLSPSARPREPRKQAKLGYLQQRELDGMHEAIEGAERRKAEIEAALADPSNYSNAERVQELSAKLASVNAEIERLYSRWQELEQE